MYSSTIIIQLQVLYWKTNYYYRSQFSLTAGGCRIKYPSFILIQACLRVPVCEHKRRTVTSKITLESLLVKKMIYPDSGATKLTNCHSKIVKSSLKVLPRNATAAGRWAELKIITNTNNSCKCCGDCSARKMWFSHSLLSPVGACAKAEAASYLCEYRWDVGRNHFG